MGRAGRRPSQDPRAGLAAYGAVALYHVAGYTPEARELSPSLIRPDAQRLAIDSLDDAYRVMDADPDLRQIDLVTVGCPHASLTEIEQVAKLCAESGWRRGCG